MSRTLGCGPSKLIAAGEPISTSILPGRPLVQPLGAIAARTIFSLGEASTSATLRWPATLMSMPVETSDCGSRSTTRVEMPFANAAEASPSVTVVLPTPPLRELTLSTCTSTEPSVTTLRGSLPHATRREDLCVQEDPGGQPRRDRDPRLPGGVRAGGE